MNGIEREETDILIVGSGGAGLFAALHAQQAAPEARRITVAVKGLLGKCGCTRMVQGGYNVALGNGDSVERHFMDTINGGKWLPNQDMAWKLCETAVERIHELENEIGCFFDRNPDGSIHRKAFAGQTADRTVHKGDLTGIEIISRLMEQVLARPIRKMQEHRAVGLDPDARRRGALGRAVHRHADGRASASCAPRPCCWRRGAVRRCTSTIRRRATRRWTGWRWRSGRGCRCATWRWCSSTRPAFSPATIRG